tara:strand:- start:415 stop:1371 length:957 start_codon:yes stop_codon:yes gene_type:complete
MRKDYQILLFYCYAEIKNIEIFKSQHHLFCIKNNIKGRVIISSEGINGTVSGLKEDCDKYRKELINKGVFSDIDFKIEEYHKNAFNKINVRIKNEIVNSGLTKKKLLKKKGKYIEPAEFKKIIENIPEDVTILDVRSNYEHNIGKFKNAMTLDIDNFRDFPEKISEIKKKVKKSNKIITYCTGGVKCEKASAFLKENGYENVYQLHGGIIKYGLQEEGENFEGKCYVFDNRIVKDVNKVNPLIIGNCYVTGKKTDRMVNCANVLCNKHFPLSDEGAKKYDGCCSEDCLENGDVRKFNGTGFYQKELNGYNPYIGLRKE